VSSDNYNLSTIKSGETLKGVTILPNRPDGTVYEGIVTFTASKPVEVVLHTGSI